MPKPRIIIHAGTARPFRVSLSGQRTRCFASFDSAVKWALSAVAVRPVREPIMPKPECVAGELRRYKVSARVSNLTREWSAVLELSARTRSAAVIAATEKWADRGLTVRNPHTRLMPKAKRDGKAARQKRNNADRSGKIRRQRDAKERRVLGLKCQA